MLSWPRVTSRLMTRSNNFMGLPCQVIRSASNARIPVITGPVLPIAALAAAYALQACDRLDLHQIFRLLVAQLPFHPQPERRAVRHAQGFVVQRAGQDGLRVERVHQVEDRTSTRLTSSH